MRLSEGGHIIDKHLSLSLDIDLIGRIAAKHEIWGHRGVERAILGAWGAVEVEGRGEVRIDRGGPVAIFGEGGRGGYRV